MFVIKIIVVLFINSNSEVLRFGCCRISIIGIMIIIIGIKSYRGCEVWLSGS